MRRVLILGGGFGGVASAHALRQQLDPDDEIIVVDRRSHFMVGFRKTWALTGQSTLEQGMRPLADLEAHGIKVLQQSVTAIDPAGRAADIDGQRMEADAIIVALGAQLAPESVPGFEKHALNVYQRDNIMQANQSLQDFKGGRVAVGIFAVPYKCPPAPYEIALALSEFFTERNVEVSLEVFTPLPLAIPAIGEAGCDILDSRLLAEGIDFHPLHIATAIEEGGVTFKDGSQRSYDLLLGIPPHRLPDVIVASGLNKEKPWIPVNASTLETGFEGVYAIGDNAAVMLANGKRLPMAGLFAELEGRVVAQRIVSKFASEQPAAEFDGVGACFLEVGNGEAVLIKGDFLARPKPLVEMTESSTAFMEDKRAFESERLESWFAAPTPV